jgi:hypothetical protein
MLQKRLLREGAFLVVLLTCTTGVVKAADDNGDRCKGLPGASALKVALDAATATETSGLNNQMWGTIVDRDGVVCAVAFSGVNRGAQWPGSRVISAQKANTATAFSLDSTSNSSGSGQPNGLSLSTANLYSAVQPVVVSSACKKATRWIREWHSEDLRQAMAQRKTQWSETRLAGSMFSAEDSRSMVPGRKSSAGSVLVETLPVLTITLPGGFETISH